MKSQYYNSKGEVVLSRWWKTPSAKAAFRRVELERKKRLRELRRKKLAQKAIKAIALVVALVSLSCCGYDNSQAHRDHQAFIASARAKQHARPPVITQRLYTGYVGPDYNTGPDPLTEYFAQEDRYRHEERMQLQEQNNGIGTTFNPLVIQYRQGVKNDCAIVALENLARLKPVTTWCKIIGFKYAVDATYIREGHAAVVFQISPGGHIMYVDVDGTLELDTKVGDLVFIRGALSKKFTSVYRVPIAVTYAQFLE